MPKLGPLHLLVTQSKLLQKGFKTLKQVYRACMDQDWTVQLGEGLCTEMGGHHRTGFRECQVGWAPPTAWDRLQAQPAPSGPLSSVIAQGTRPAGMDHGVPEGPQRAGPHSCGHTHWPARAATRRPPSNSERREWLSQNPATTMKRLGSRLSARCCHG